MKRQTCWYITGWMVLLLPVAGWAELYCAVNFAGKRCYYQDMESCRKAAGPQGDCILNTERMQAPVGGAPVCLVESWQTQCIYQDLVSCRHAAMPRHAACIRNPNYR